MQRKPRTHFTPYVGNVTANIYRRNNRQKVIWEKGKKYSEEQMARMLQDAYVLGREEALEDVDDGIQQAKKP